MAFADPHHVALAAADIEPIQAPRVETKATIKAANDLNLPFEEEAIGLCELFPDRIANQLFVLVGIAVKLSRFF